MKRASRSRSQSHPKRTSSPPRSVRVDLKPGEVLVTNDVIVMARMGGGFGGLGVTTTVTCECTKAEPDMPDCKPKTTTFPGGVSVSCKMSGGCSQCKSTTTTTSFGLVMA